VVHEWKVGDRVFWQKRKGRKREPGWINEISTSGIAYVTLFNPQAELYKTVPAPVTEQAIKHWYKVLEELYGENSTLGPPILKPRKKLVPGETERRRGQTSEASRKGRRGK
jgi:hypothetical protein